MEDEERLEGDEEMDLDEATDGEDDDDDAGGILISPASSDQLLSPVPTPGNNYINISESVHIISKFETI